jgi:hypothetical protein
MSKPVVLSEGAWLKIYNHIAKHYPACILLIRNRMKEVLGFTVRRHRAYVKKLSGGYYDELICLDFYNEPKRTMFLLKYSEFINDTSN